MDYNERKNKEGYTDSTAYGAIRIQERRKKAYYVFQTMISCARLAGFYVNDALVIEDSNGTKYNSDDIMHRGNNKPNV